MSKPTDEPSMPLGKIPEMEQAEQDKVKPPASEAVDVHDKIRDALKFLWEQYRASHMSNLMYSVSFIGAVLVYLQKIGGDKLKDEALQHAIEATLGFAMLAAGLAMIQRFTSQFFMEMEIFHDEKTVDGYYTANGTLRDKVTYSYAYPWYVLEPTRYLHNLSKLFSSFFLYTALFLFINFVIVPIQRNVSRTLGLCDTSMLKYWLILPIFLFLTFTAAYFVIRGYALYKFSKPTKGDV